ncbi:hypothetical protein ACLOJK_019170, partial [Asimina triloba]
MSFRYTHRTQYCGSIRKSTRKKKNNKKNKNKKKKKKKNKNKNKSIPDLFLDSKTDALILNNKKN